MRLLLDTHVWLWYLAGSAELPSKFKDVINDSMGEIWLSPISVWETIVLGEKGRVRLKPNPVSFAREALDRCNFRDASLTREIALKSREIDLPHHDPADRFLAATTLVYDLTLATTDRALRQAAWLSTVPL